MTEELHVAPGLGFIFDMDGVVIESTEMHTVAWGKYLEAQGVAREGLTQTMLGKRNDDIVAALFGDHLSPETVHEHGAAKERLYRELMAPVLDDNVVSGVIGFVTAAHRAGIPCALATNAEPLNAEFVLARTGLKECFAAIVDGHQVDRPKPDPEIVLSAACRLGLPPEDCIVFEDSPGGMKAARAAGARLVALLTTLEAAPEADLAVADFNDPRLRPWLSTLSPRSASRR